ncbi:MAG: DNA methyltransferase [Verrucomicrobiae bacterium]
MRPFLSILAAGRSDPYFSQSIMTVAEFQKKWSRYQGKESSAYQGHFDDLCRLLGRQPPAEADPSGGDSFCFQKRVVKDAEIFGAQAGEPTERGFADVWKRGCFAWEYKGKKKNLDEAYRQLLRYREALLNPPLLVVCDFDRYIVRTNFNGTVQEVHEFTNAEIDRPENWRLLRALFENPEFLKPQRTTAEVTRTLASQIAEIAKSLQGRESVELADAKSRKEVNVAQKKNLRIARFLNRIVFCFFAEDTGLLPKKLFTEIAGTALADPAQFAAALEELFRVMAGGGMFGHHKIRHFNGHLFEEASVFELTESELRQLAAAGESDWQFIEPGIMGTLFERALEPEQRSQLGAHYTGEADIKTLVEPVLMQPLRREWSKIQGELAAAFVKGKGTAAQRERLAKFQNQLAAVTVLDPACGSGNFLYVSLQLLLGLEKDVLTFATQLGFAFKPQVGVRQLKAIEINPYAFELAQVSVQIGFLQWRRDNGFDNDRSPVLQNLDGFQNEDALLVPHFRSKAKSLKDAQAGEHAGNDALKFYTERDWPDCDVIVGNPPFLGGSKLWEELGRNYQKELWKIYDGRVPGFADLCCYWFDKARRQIEKGKCKRAGLLATQAIRGGANREVLKRIKATGDIFFAESDRDWILESANVHVSMIGFDDGTETVRVLDGKVVPVIHPNLTFSADITLAKSLVANEHISFKGTCKAGPMDIQQAAALNWLHLPNPHGRPNSDVLRPWVSGSAIVKRPNQMWIVDAGVDMSLSDFFLYEEPSRHVLEKVKPEREKNNRAAYREKWWIHAEARPGMRMAFSPLSRYVVTPRISKHRVFIWADTVILPDDGTFTFARSDDYFFGIVHSRLHEIWSLRLGTRLETRPRYTPTTCFETFPFPFADDLAEQTDNFEAKLDAAKHYKHIVLREDPPAGRVSEPEDHRAAIADAAKELDALRERWLNPPEWTVEKILEFPASIGGPWSRHVVTPYKNGVGTARYRRLVPKDAECAARLKKRTLTALYNERPAWLDFAHKKLDDAVAAAYGWPGDLSGEEILERLLALNLERAEARAATGKKPQRAKSDQELL